VADLDPKYAASAIAVAERNPIPPRLTGKDACVSWDALKGRPVDSHSADCTASSKPANAVVQYADGVVRAKYPIREAEHDARRR
jgi:hypothetical protein